jgi:hypothetical protein
MPIIGSSGIKTTGAITLGDGPEDIHALHGFLSGSAISTGSFGHLIIGGQLFTTAVSSSAAAAGFGVGGGGSGAGFPFTGNAVITGSLNVTNTFTLGNISDVSASLAIAVAGADNLGSHTASLDLDMNSNSIKDISTGSFDRVEVGGDVLGPFGIANVISAFELDGFNDLMPNNIESANIVDFNYETDANGDLMPRATSLI